MGDYGQIIDPYRVAPAQGSMEDYFRMGAMQDKMVEERKKAALLQMTQQFLAQQAGLPQGVDPFATQDYKVKGDTNTRAWNADGRAGAQEGRMAQDHQSRYDAARKISAAAPEQTDPYLRMLQAAGANPYGVEPMVQAMSGDYSRKGEYDNRLEINKANLASAEAIAAAQNAAALNRGTAERKQKQEFKKEDQADFERRHALFEKDGNLGNFSAEEQRMIGPENLAIRAESIQKRNADRQKQEQLAIEAQKRESDRLARESSQADSDAKVRAVREKMGMDKKLGPVEPNAFFSDRIVTPSRQGDSVLQRQYDNAKNIVGFIPRTMYEGGKDLGYKGAELIDYILKNIRF